MILSVVCPVEVVFLVVVVLEVVFLVVVIQKDDFIMVIFWVWSQFLFFFFVRRDPVGMEACSCSVVQEVDCGLGDQSCDVHQIVKCWFMFC